MIVTMYGPVADPTSDHSVGPLQTGRCHVTATVMACAVVAEPFANACATK